MKKPDPSEQEVVGHTTSALLTNLGSESETPAMSSNSSTVASKSDDKTNNSSGEAAAALDVSSLVQKALDRELVQTKIRGLLWKVLP